MNRLIIVLVFVISLPHLGANAQINTDRLIANGRNALYFEDYVLSIQYFNQVIRSKPYLAEPYFFRGVAKISLEDYNGAEQDCSSALERNPFIVKAYECRGIARLNSGKEELAINDFDKALEFRPGDKHLQLCKGVTLLQAKKYDDAIAELTSSISTDSKYVEAYINRGHAYLGKEDTIKALSDFDKVLSIDKFKSEGHASKGIVLCMQGKYKEALACYDEAIRLKPERPGYYLNRAIIRYNMKNLRGTMSDFDQAIRLDPENRLALYNRALLRSEVGDRNNALLDFNHVLEIDPDDDMAMYNRALIEIEVGELNQAIKDINTLLAKHPDFYPLYYNRAEAKKLKGDKRGAQLDYNQAMIMELDSHDKKPKTDDKKTRKKDEKNLKNFKRLVIADREDEERRFSYKSENRGRIQNVNHDVEIEPIFFISRGLAKENMRKSTLFTSLSDLNKLPYFHGKLTFDNKARQTNEQKKTELFRTIEERTSLIEKAPDVALYIARAMDYDMLCAFHNALEDYNKAINADPANWIAYFNRAAVRHKLLETHADEDSDNNETNISLQVNLMMDDYKKVAELCPDMYFAFYNMGNIMIEEKNYDDAISYYTRAIERNNDFGEAYFNRGLTYIFIGKNDKGISDLSKAGELGLYSAYNFIKRFTVNE